MARPLLSVEEYLAEVLALVTPLSDVEAVPLADAAGRTLAEPVLSRIVGKHCEAGDIVVKDEFLPGDVAPGDLVAVPGTGAYCRSMASNYNHALRPPVIGVRDGKTFTVLRRETEDDMFATDTGVS